MTLLRWLLLRVVCLPVDACGALIIALFTIGSARWELKRGVAYVHAAESWWLARRWHYSTTLGHVVLLSPRATDETVRHELVHVRQCEAVCCAWALAALLSWSAMMLYLWPLAWLLFDGAAALAAWLAGRDPYYGNVLEQHAYKEAS